MFSLHVTFLWPLLSQRLTPPPPLFCGRKAAETGNVTWKDHAYHAKLGTFRPRWKSSWWRMFGVGFSYIHTRSYSLWSYRSPAISLLWPRKLHHEDCGSPCSVVAFRLPGKQWFLWPCLSPSSNKDSPHLHQGTRKDHAKFGTFWSFPRGPVLPSSEARRICSLNLLPSKALEFQATLEEMMAKTCNFIRNTTLYGCMKIRLQTGEQGLGCSLLRTP